MLSQPERKQLKARAHKLEPVVTIGGKGVSDELVREVDTALKAHELVKVRARGLERDEREEAMKTLCERTGADAVQSIGNVLILYRKRDA